MKMTELFSLAEEYANAHFAEAIDLLKTIGAIPAPSGKEDRRAAFIRDLLLSWGAENVTIDEAKNVVLPLGVTETNDLVVFEAHTDVVFPDETALPVVEKDGKIYAPGIGDDTANLVNLLLCAKYLIEHPAPLSCGLLIVANSCEEGLGNLKGTRRIFADYAGRIKAFYSFDGTFPFICDSAVGSNRYKISIHTAGGHSFANFPRPNAIKIMCGLVEDLYNIPLSREGINTYNVGRIEGGTTVNSIAQDCSILFELRSTSDRSLNAMAKSLEGKINRHRDLGGEIQCELIGKRPGNGPIDEAALAALTAKTADCIRRFIPDRIILSPSSTDSNIPLSLGIPANTLGTVRGEKAHTREEWMEMESMRPGLAVALSVMLSACISPEE